MAVLVSSGVAACSSVTGSRGGDESGRLTIKVRVARMAPPTIHRPESDAADVAPVPGAEVVVVDSAGREVERLRTGDDGTVTVSLPAGRYRLHPQPVPGYLGTAPDTTVEVGPGGDRQVDFDYDAGVR